MLNKIRNRKGFTLIELLIVVAIIGILAAIAIPQFSAYRMRGYNSTALSDMKNAKTAQESLYADSQCYGNIDAAAALLTAAAPATGNTLTGPQAAAVGGAAPVAGARFAGQNAGGATGAIPVGISNGVNLRTDTSVDPGSAPVINATNSYVISARHNSADTAYASDSDNTTVTYRVSNSQWAGNAGAGIFNNIAATLPGATIGVDNLTGFGGGGLPTVNWTIM